MSDKPDTPAWMKPVRRIEKAELREEAVPLGRILEGVPGDTRLTITFGEKVNLWPGDRLVIIQKVVPPFHGQEAGTVTEMWFVAQGEAMP
jgi:hypothetical protein